MNDKDRVEELREALVDTIHILEGNLRRTQTIPLATEEKKAWAFIERIVRKVLLKDTLEEGVMPHVQR